MGLRENRKQVRMRCDFHARLLGDDRDGDPIIIIFPYNMVIRENNSILNTECIVKQGWRG